MRVINLCTTENKVVIMTSAKRGENWNQITVDNFIPIFGLEKSGGSGGLKELPVSAFQIHPLMNENRPKEIISSGRNFFTNSQ